MKYSLYSGAGNRFALTEAQISSTQASTLSHACDVDGVIACKPYRETIVKTDARFNPVVYEKSELEKTFYMRTFNRDGTEAQMCGNGLRCLIKFLIKLNISLPVYRIETGAGTHFAWANDNTICVQIPPPKDLHWNLCINNQIIHYLNTGVPHAMIFVDCVNTIDLVKRGSSIRYHSFFPEGVNVNFFQLNPLRVRTYERGVEAETLACGTGVVATALIAAKLFNLLSPVCVHVQSGDVLTICFNQDWTTIVMEGPAVYVGEGIFL